MDRWKKETPERSALGDLFLKTAGTSQKPFPWKVLRTVVAASSFFFLMCSYYIIKPTRSPIINTYIGSEFLHVFYAANALVSLAGILVYNHFVGKYPRTQLLRVFFGVVVLFFFALVALFQIPFPTGHFGGKVVAATHFFFVCAYILFCTALFWSFNHDIHTPGDAERFYPYVNLGAQLGVIAGSELVAMFPRNMEILLFSAAAGLVLCWALLEVLKLFDPDLERNRYAKPAATGAIEDAKLFFTNRYVLCIGLVVIFATFTPTLGDLQFNWLLDNSLLQEGQNPGPLKERDFKNLPRFAQKLHLQKDPLTLHAWHSLSPRTAKFLETYEGGPLPEDLAESLLADINSLLRAGSLYDARRFANIEIGENRKRQVQKDLGGEELVLLNRVLLEEAYPNELHHSQKAMQTRLWAKINSRMGWCNIAMCLAITPTLFWLFGPIRAICLYPLILFVFGIALLRGASIQTMAYLYTAALTLNYAFYNVGKEVFFVPTDKNVKYKIKAFCESFLFRLGDAGAAGIFQIYLLLVGGVWILGLSYVVFGVVGIWIHVILRAGKQYRALCDRLSNSEIAESESDSKGTPQKA